MDLVTESIVAVTVPFLASPTVVVRFAQVAVVPLKVSPVPDTLKVGVPDSLSVEPDV